MKEYDITTSSRKSQNKQWGVEKLSYGWTVLVHCTTYTVSSLQYTRSDYHHQHSQHLISRLIIHTYFVWNLDLPVARSYVLSKDISQDGMFVINNILV